MLGFSVSGYVKCEDYSFFHMNNTVGKQFMTIWMIKVRDSCPSEKIAHESNKALKNIV